MLKVNSPHSSFYTKVKYIFWPINRSEMKLFIPFSLMMFCMLFNFGALRSIKDSLLVPNIGAEAISFVKLWLVLPSTIIFTLIYVKLSNILKHQYLFYLISSFFLAFFVIFSYIIYPLQHYLHPSDLFIKNMMLAYPHLKWFLLILSKWSYAVMYIFCELWSAIIINLLFWQYANRIFNTKEAARLYPILGMIGNTGLIAAGIILVFISNVKLLKIDINYAVDIHFQCKAVLQPMILIIILMGGLMMLLYGYITQIFHQELHQNINHDNYNNVNHNSSTSITNDAHKCDQNNSKTSLNVVDSIKLILQSSYIGNIAVLVLSYGLVINILEGPWKAMIKQLYPNTIDYMNFMGYFNIYMGISSVIFTVIGSNILRKTQWVTSAMITPIMLLITGSIFFTLIIVEDVLYKLSNWTNPLYFAVIIGAIQNILSKSTKYSLFDSTKEMAYIPLSLELKTKGKAAIEVIGLKFGKALGAFIQSSVFIIFPMINFSLITEYFMAIFMVIIMFWIHNIRSLNIKYQNLIIKA